MYSCLNTPAPIECAFQLKVENDLNSYAIYLSENNENLSVVAKEVGSFPIEKYSNEFSIEQLQHSSKFFKMFDNVSEIIPDLSGLFENNKASLYKQSQTVLLLKFTVSFKITTEIVLELHLQNEKECPLQDSKTVIEDLCTALTSMNKTVRTLNEKVSKLENELSFLLKDESIFRIYRRQQTLSNSDIFQNEAEITIVKNWISQTQQVNMKCIFKASKDGDDCVSLRNICEDAQSPTLIVIKTTKGLRFGGFTKARWDFSGKFKRDSYAFIFSLDSFKRSENAREDDAIFCSPRSNVSGPVFGGGNDIWICDKFLNKENGCYCNGRTYSGFNGFELNGGEKKFTVCDLEVYAVSFK